MKLAIAAALIALSVPSFAQDRALVLNDQEAAALRQVLDQATRSGDTKFARITVYLLNKLEAAPIVTDHKDDPPEATKDTPQ